MRPHPLENDCDERAESWAELFILIVIALLAGVACMIWDGAIDGWHFLLRKQRR
jgi:hypothetical protein